jgi:pilus assembly protein Flp/PilA
MGFAEFRTPAAIGSLSPGASRRFDPTDFFRFPGVALRTLCLCKREPPKGATPASFKPALIGRALNSRVGQWSSWRHSGENRSLRVKTKVETSMNLFVRFARDNSGATAIEYGLIAALIAVVIITAVTSVGTNLSTTFTTVAGKLL